MSIETETKYAFTPQPDITPYELALCLQLFNKKGPLAKELQLEFIQAHREVRRHFTAFESPKRNFLTDLKILFGWS